jgi:hypothetical protein
VGAEVGWDGDKATLRSWAGSSGRIEPAQLAWLEAELAAHARAPIARGESVT